MDVEAVFFRFFVQLVRVAELLASPAVRRLVERAVLLLSVALLAALVVLHTTVLPSYNACLAKQEQPWDFAHHQVVSVEIHGWTHDWMELWRARSSALRKTLAVTANSLRAERATPERGERAPEWLEQYWKDGDLDYWVEETRQQEAGRREKKKKKSSSNNRDDDNDGFRRREFLSSLLQLQPSKQTLTDAGGQPVCRRDWVLAHPPAVRYAPMCLDRQQVYRLAASESMEDIESETPLTDAFLLFLFAQSPTDYQDLERFFRLQRKMQTIAEILDSVDDGDIEDEEEEDEDGEEEDSLDILVDQLAQLTELYFVDTVLEWMTWWNPRYEVSLSKAYLFLPKDLYGVHNVTSKRVVISANDTCFGNSVATHLLANLIGYDTAVLNAIFSSTNGQSFVYNVRSRELYDMRGALDWMGFAKEYDLVDFVYAKLCAVVMALFLYDITIITAHLAFRETQIRTLGFTIQVHRLMRNMNLRILWALCSSYVTAIAIYLLAILGIIFFLARMLENAGMLSFLIMLLYWSAEHYVVLCARTRATMQVWPVLFFLYQLAFFIYYFSVPFSFYYLAFAVDFGLCLHSMLYFLNHFDIPALHSQQISLQHPREAIQTIETRPRGVAAGPRRIFVNQNAIPPNLAHMTTLGPRHRRSTSGVPAASGYPAATTATATATASGNPPGGNGNGGGDGANPTPTTATTTTTRRVISLPIMRVHRSAGPGVHLHFQHADATPAAAAAAASGSSSPPVRPIPSPSPAGPGATHPAGTQAGNRDSNDDHDRNSTTS